MTTTPTAVVIQVAAALPQRVVARALGITQPSVSMKVNGQRAWSLRDVERLNAVLPPGERLVLVPERETLDYAAAQARDAAAATRRTSPPAEGPKGRRRTWADVPLIPELSP